MGQVCWSLTGSNLQIIRLSACHSILVIIIERMVAIRVVSLIDDIIYTELRSLIAIKWLRRANFIINFRLRIASEQPQNDCRTNCHQQLVYFVRNVEVSILCVCVCVFVGAQIEVIWPSTKTNAIFSTIITCRFHCSVARSSVHRKTFEAGGIRRMNGDTSLHTYASYMQCP